MIRRIWKIVQNNLILVKITSTIYSFIMLNIIRGRINNKIINNGSYLKKCKIHINGKENKIIFDKGVRLLNCVIRIHGNNCILHIKNNCTIENLIFHFEDNGCQILIGINNVFSGGEFAVAENNSVIEIGNNCLFSRNVEIITTDSHSILDRTSSMRINHAKNIKIGDNVWIGAHVSLLKGTNIPSGCVIGRNAVVTKPFYTENCIIAGIPANVIKENVLWQAERIQNKID